MFRARAPSEGCDEIRDDARSSSSRIAFGALGRLRRHHSSAARICGLAMSLTSTGSGRLTRGCEGRPAATPLESFDRVCTARSTRVAPLRSWRPPRTSHPRRVQAPLQMHLRAGSHRTLSARRPLSRKRFAYGHSSSGGPAQPCCSRVHSSDWIHRGTLSRRSPRVQAVTRTARHPVFGGLSVV